MNHLWKNRLLLIILCGILGGVGLGVFATVPSCSTSGPRYCNPLGSTNDIVELTKVILKYLLQITIPLAVLAVIASGLYYVITSVSGNSSKLPQAKSALTHILIGSVLVVGANALALAVINFLKNLP